MMTTRMRRGVFAAAGVAGAALLAVLVPLYDAPEPRGLTVTRGKVREVADAEARKWGIEVDKAFVVTTVDGSPLLDKELRDKPDLWRRAAADPALGPRLFGFRVAYWRNGVDKYPPFGDVAVSRTGEVLAVRRQARMEEPGAAPKAEDLRPKADAFVSSRVFAGAPYPVYEDARPSVQRNRTDHTFRYKVASALPTGDVVCYLYVTFVGDQLSGYQLIEEYRDGRRFVYDTGLGATFLRFGEIFTLLFVLLAIFLKKYHAGEVGVGTGAVLFAAAIALCITATALIGPWSATGTGLGGADARTTTLAVCGFKFLFYDIPLSVLVFLAWSVGESLARERWGERLASFDAVLKRDPLNATVGGSLLAGSPRRAGRRGRGPPRPGPAVPRGPRLGQARLRAERGAERDRGALRSRPLDDARRPPLLVRRAPLPPRLLPPAAPPSGRRDPDGGLRRPHGDHPAARGAVRARPRGGLRRDRRRPPRLRVLGPPRGRRRPRSAAG